MVRVYGVPHIHRLMTRCLLESMDSDDQHAHHLRYPCSCLPVGSATVTGTWIRRRCLLRQQLPGLELKVSRRSLGKRHAMSSMLRPSQVISVTGKDEGSALILTVVAGCGRVRAAHANTTKDVSIVGFTTVQHWTRQRTRCKHWHRSNIPLERLFHLERLARPE